MDRKTYYSTYLPLSTRAGIRYLFGTGGIDILYLRRVIRFRYFGTFLKRVIYYRYFDTVFRYFTKKLIGMTLCTGQKPQEP